MSKAPFILLVNPWITDFAAYDLWAKPLGLLQLASLLREGGCGVALVDCLDRHDPMTAEHLDILPGADRNHGTGKYPRTPIQKPEPYSEIPRLYFRYGIHPESLLARLRSFPKPDLIWVTSIMTYWYPGLHQTIAHLRQVFPEVPIWLGGTYAKLCTEHARGRSGPTEVISLPIGTLPDKILTSTHFSLKNKPLWADPDHFPIPALDLISRLSYIPIMTSRGCPFHCPYCASRILQPKWKRRSGQAIYEEIIKWYEQTGVSDYAFYDDALLLGAEFTLKPALERIAAENLPLRFHTPNAVHIRALSPDWANLLHRSGFTTIRLGLETTRAEHQINWGGKVENEMFFRAVARLLSAGFPPAQVGVYLMCGLPQQSPAEVAEAISTVQEAGVQPYLCEYSPVPGTLMWAEACRLSKYPLEEEPLYHNNTFFACRRPGFSYEDLLQLKKMARQARKTSDPVKAGALTGGVLD